MSYQNLLNGMIHAWSYTRSETTEILASLEDSQLQFKPQGEKWQPLYYQFLCIAQAQKAYTEAIKSGQLNFNNFDIESERAKNQTKQALLKDLTQLNDEWLKQLKSKLLDEDFKISWPNYQTSLIAHIAALAEHERLHHGQLISYFTLAGFDLPEGFKRNWAL